MSTRPPTNELWYDQGSFVNVADPHLLRPAQSVGAAGGPFYTINADGSIKPAAQDLAESYPYGPIYPNLAAYYPSVPGKIDIQFGYRPFN